ncbi:5'-deoxynucleotidase [Fusarium sp. Ph1]|nr:5'-deoxynucleotidase [Fusarium sp. Ph1]
MATTAQDLSRLSIQVIGLIGQSRGETVYRIRLREQIVSLDNLLQLWGDGHLIPNSEAVDGPLQRLATTLSKLELDLDGESPWPFTQDHTEKLVSEVQIEIIAMRQAMVNKRVLTSDCPGYPATVAEAVQSLRRRTPLAFMSLINGLKSLYREGWLRKGMKHPESVASHSFGVALLCLFAPPELDRSKCIMIGIIHDFAECLVGDITPHDGVDKEQKSQLEGRAWRFIKEYLEHYDKPTAQLIYDLWLEYENPASPEGRWVKQADKLECVNQAVDYEKQFSDLDLEEFQGLKSKITSPDLQLWLTLLQEYREVYRSEQEQRLPLSAVIGDLPFDDGDCARHCQELGIGFIAWPRFLYGDSTDSPKARYCRGSQASDGLVPDEQAVDLLWAELERRRLQGARCVLVKGFPSNKKQRVQFATKARRVRLGLLVLEHENELQHRSSLNVQVQEDMPADRLTNSVYVKVKTDETIDEVVMKLKLYSWMGLN